MPPLATQHELNNFLRHLHLGSEVYYVGQLCDAWHMSTPGGSDAATFHLVCNGEAWIHMTDGSPPTRMTAGDIAFFARDAAHTFSAHADVPQQPFDYSHPAPLDRDAPGAGLLCGHLRLPAHVRRLLLAALSDEPLRPAVSAFIDAPAEVWTVARMARLACQSRSTFSEHFTRQVRMPPMEFVTLWRMQLASALLADSHANMLDVAMKCGYESEAAFRKAFKRVVGVPPGKIKSSHL